MIILVVLAASAYILYTRSISGGSEHLQGMVPEKRDGEISIQSAVETVA